MQIWEELHAALRVGTPLVAIVTADQPGTTRQIGERLDATEAARGRDPRPVFQLDSAQGLTGVTPTGWVEVRRLLGDQAPVPDMVGICADLLPKLPEGSVVLWQNAGDTVTHPIVAQAICNLRDPYKATLRTVVMLGPSVPLPLSLSTDTLFLTEPLPNVEQLGEIVDLSFENAARGPGERANAETHRKAVAAVRGLSSFAAENAIAWSLRRQDGVLTLDLERLWSLKRAAVETTHGLRFSESNHTFADITGLDSFKQYVQRLNAGPRPITGVIFIDEIDKAMAGAIGPSGDNGVAADRLGQLLQYMERRKVRGSLLLGPAGTGKTYLAEGTGNTLRVPTLTLDLGGLVGGIQGSSQGYIRSALSVIDAVVGGDALYLATCNRLETLPPEMRRRFKRGPYFFDLPTKPELALLWDFYLRRYELAHQASLEKLPDDTDWTPNDVAVCVTSAWEMGCSLRESAETIVPIARQDPQGVTALRELAHNKFLSAQHWGLYRKPAADLVALTPGARRMEVE